MKTSDLGIDLIKRYEGRSLKAYKCPAGVITIGYGHTKSVKIWEVISAQQAEDYLVEDLEELESQISKVLPGIKQNQFDACVSFAFNVGFTAFKKSTLFKKIKTNADATQIDIEFRKWNKAGGKVLEGLDKRRVSESYLFIFGKNNF